MVPASLIFKKVYAMPPPMIIMFTFNHCDHPAYGDIKTWCPLEQQVLHNEEMKKKDRITCKPKELVAKMHCVSFFWSTCSREEINKAALSLVKHVHDQLDFVADLYFRLS